MYENATLMYTLSQSLFKHLKQLHHSLLYSQPKSPLTPQSTCYINIPFNIDLTFDLSVKRLDCFDK